MQFVERSADVLRIISFYRFTGATAAIFDRSKTRAVIISFMMLVPIRRTTFPLDDIAAVQMRKRERPNGHAVYGLTLRRKRGEDVPMHCRSRQDAIRSQRAITEFLALA
jgi:hypothetical protein